MLQPIKGYQIDYKQLPLQTVDQKVRKHFEIICVIIIGVSINYVFFFFAVVLSSWKNLHEQHNLTKLSLLHL